MPHSIYKNFANEFANSVFLNKLFERDFYQMFIVGINLAFNSDFFFTFIHGNIIAEITTNLR